jgi:hypothetical protein
VGLANPFLFLWVDSVGLPRYILEGFECDIGVSSLMGGRGIKQLPKTPAAVYYERIGGG